MHIYKLFIQAFQTKYYMRYALCSPYQGKERPFSHWHFINNLPRHQIMHNIDAAIWFTEYVTRYELKTARVNGEYSFLTY